MSATIKETIVVKGRRTPFEFEIEVTPHGVVIASDREHERVFTIRWSGVEPGTAAEVGALALDRAGTWTEFRAALVKWKMPARRVIYADVDGNVGFQDAALVPLRRRSPEWGGWLTLDDLPHGLKSRAGSVAAESPLRRADSVARQAVFAHVLGISAPARRRFNVGPVNRRDVDDSPFRAIFDPAAWDRSRAIIAPGQSGSPGSAHFADLATVWGGGDDFTLAFTEAAVQANAESTLTLVGRGPR